MPERTEIESSIVEILTFVEENGQRVFQDVAASAVTDKRHILTLFGRANGPAARVIVKSRKHEKESVTVVRVYLAFKQYESGGGQRIGFNALSGLTLRHLNRAILNEHYRLHFAEETILQADQKLIVAEQNYEIVHVSLGALPTFGGSIITGSDSIMNVVIGPVRADTQYFCFPGIDGVFGTQLGSRGRTITWDVILRAENNAELNTLEASIEALVNIAPQTMTDSHGREYRDCILTNVKRIGVRKTQFESTGVEQNVELTFVWATG